LSDPGESFGKGESLKRKGKRGKAKKNRGTPASKSDGRSKGKKTQA